MSHLYLLGVATLTLTSAGFAGSDTNADLQARLEAAEARINELTAATNNNWLNDARSDEIRGLVHDVLADADTRASLQGSAGNAGYNNGFTIGSADGNWSLTINGLLQARWTYADNDNDAIESAWGFSTERSWLNFDGTIAGDYGYHVRHTMSGDGGDVGRGGDWAYGTMGVGDDWTLAAGDMKVATSREALIDDQNQLAMDRTDWNWITTDGYVVGTGAALSWQGDDLSFSAAMINNFAEGPANADSHIINLRIEYMAEGNWSQFDQFTSADGGAAGTLVGFSYLTADAGDAPATLLADDDSYWTLDVQMQFGGSNLYVAYSDFDDDDGAGGDWDALEIMYGLYLDADWELYGRWSDKDTDDDGIFTVGLNNYLSGQNAKWTTKVRWDDTDSANETTTIATQLQFYF